MDLDAIIYHVGVAFNDGQMELAASRAEAFSSVGVEEFGPNQHKIQGPLVYCIGSKRYDVASTLVNKVYPHLSAVLGEGPGPAGAPEIMWTKNGSENKFDFAPSLDKYDFIEKYTIISRWYSVLKICNAYTLAGLSDGRTIIGVGDFAGSPGLSFCDNRGSFTTLIPDGSFLESNAYMFERASIMRAWLSYDQRHPVAFWRGSSTGRIGYPRKDTPRVKLCLLGSKAPNLLDCLISQIVQADATETAELNKLDIIGPWIDTSELVKYRIQIDIDGNTNSWPGLFTKLLTGSPVIKISSEENYKQWYYDRMTPFSDFVPVESNMSNLYDVVEMLLKDEALAERIGRNGREFAEAMTVQSEIMRCLPTVENAMRSG